MSVKVGNRTFKNIDQIDYIVNNSDRRMKEVGDEMVYKFLPRKKTLH